MLPGFLATLDCWRELPAAVSAASAAAITAVTVPASASAPTATTTTARSSSASAPTATTAAARSPSASATATLTRRPGFVNNNVAAHEIVAVQSLDGALGFLVAIDLDKSEPAWLP